MTQQEIHETIIENEYFYTKVPVGQIQDAAARLYAKLTGTKYHPPYGEAVNLAPGAPGRAPDPSGSGSGSGSAPEAMPPGSVCDCVACRKEIRG
jgi:hypothetical protein